MKKNILVLGSGGRESAFVWKLAQDKNVGDIYCMPGNAGTKIFAKNIDIELSNKEAILDFVIKNDIFITIVGPEAPLADGIVDYFREHNHKIFGPTKYASQLESSKIYARDLMKEYNIPHPDYIACSNLQEVKEAKNSLGLPIVLKADGLAAGKGVIICKDESEFSDALAIFFDNKNFGDASEKISVERCIEGPEVSVFTICNGKDYVIINNAQDHKRIFDGDLGPNTGGMGAYAPTSLYNETLEDKIKKRIIEPTLKAMIDKGSPYTGFLYFGLMLVNEEPYVIEYNVRMGDPETQVVMPMMKNSLLEVIQNSLEGNLGSIRYENHDGYCVTIVLSADGYPGKYAKNLPIKGLNNLEEELVFHAGTSLNDGNQYVTSGGRVLNVVGQGKTLADAIDSAYKVISHIEFEGMYFRKDIGQKGLNY